MKVYRFDTIYPRTFWIVNSSKEHPNDLLKRFIFYKNTPGWQEIDKNIDEELDNAKDTATAGCYVVEEKSTGLLGVLLVIFRDEDMNSSIIAHESVHIADFYFEVTGCNSEDFTEGNEAYAYLVGWAAGCIANALIKENNGKTK